MIFLNYLLCFIAGILLNMSLVHLVNFSETRHHPIIARSKVPRLASTLWGLGYLFFGGLILLLLHYQFTLSSCDSPVSSWASVRGPSSWQPLPKKGISSIQELKKIAFWVWPFKKRILPEFSDRFKPGLIFTPILWLIDTYRPYMQQARRPGFAHQHHQQCDCSNCDAVAQHSGQAASQREGKPAFAAFAETVGGETWSGNRSGN